jgi:hypothetical protein
MIKKELINLKNISKDLNRERSMRKQEFQISNLQDKLTLDERKFQALVEERNNLKNIRISTLVESEIQRDQIKNALY